MDNRNLRIFLIIILGLFASMNLRNSHDWGGDFSAYLSQSKNLSEGSAMCDFGYIYNPSYDRLAPPCYPPGYPVLLAPVYWISSGNVAALLIFQTLLGVLFLALSFKLFRWRLTTTDSILLLAVFALNPWMMTFKSELTADLPFSLFFLSAYLLYLKFRHRKAWWSMLVVGLCVGFVISIKGAGIALIPPILLDIFLFERKHRTGSSRWRSASIYVLAISVSVLLIYLLAGQNLTDNFAYFGGVAQRRIDVFVSTSTNLKNYLSIYMSFFQKDVEPFGFLALLSGTGMLWMTLIGFGKRLFNNPGIGEWTVLSMMGLLIAFPITNGLRYLAPLLPFLLRYAFEALPKNWDSKKRTRFLVWVSIFLIAQYSVGWLKVWEIKDPVEGPQAVTELWDQLKTNDSNVVVVADKPRVVAYYGELKAMSVSPDADSSSVIKQIKDLNIHHVMFLSIRATPNPAIDQFFDQNWKPGERWKLRRLDLH